MFMLTCSSSLLIRFTIVISCAIGLIVQPFAQAQERITVKLSADGKQLQAQWMGQTHTIEAKGFTVNVLDALDCSKLKQVDQLSLSGQRFLGTPTVDLNTGNIAVGILLSECVETQQTAVFVISPLSESYTSYLVQVPGKRPLANKSFTYAINNLLGLQYWDELLLVRQGDAAGNQSLLVYKRSQTPAGEYRGCISVETIEGTGLCPRSK